MSHSCCFCSSCCAWERWIICTDRCEKSLSKSSSGWIVRISSSLCEKICLDIVCKHSLIWIVRSTRFLCRRQIHTGRSHSCRT